MFFINYFLLLLFITLIVEIPVAVAMIKYIFKDKINIREIIFWDAFASLFTFPYLWFIFQLIIPPAVYSIYLGEIIVVILEAVILAKGLKLRFNKAIILSFVANLASYAVGLLVNVIIRKYY